MKFHSLIVITALMILGGLVGIAAAEEVCEYPVACDPSIESDSATSDCCCCCCIDPRSPGYWKNWNSCSNGTQADMLTGLLPQTVGKLTIEKCECKDAVAILSGRDIGNSKNMNSDAAYTLAKALLAAKLNVAAGACKPKCVEFNCGCTHEWLTFCELLCRADNLLCKIDFDGTGYYLGPKNKDAFDDRAEALCLYEILDDYNNGRL